MTRIFSRRTIEKHGSILFQFRAWIAVPFFVLLVLFSRPAVYPGIAGALLIMGLMIRLWAAGYIGVSARATQFATRFRITSGPYRSLRHPLYIGNFLLVLGVVILFNPPLFYALVIMVLFIAIYGMIVLCEQVYIKTLVEKNVVFHIKNCAAEIWTVIVLGVIVLVYLIVQKDILS